MISWKYVTEIQCVRNQKLVELMISKRFRSDVIKVNFDRDERYIQSIEEIFNVMLKGLSGEGVFSFISSMLWIQDGSSLITLQMQIRR